LGDYLSLIFFFLVFLKLFFFYLSFSRLVLHEDWQLSRLLHLPDPPLTIEPSDAVYRSLTRWQHSHRQAWHLHQQLLNQQGEN